MFVRLLTTFRQTIFLRDFMYTSLRGIFSLKRREQLLRAPFCKQGFKTCYYYLRKLSKSGLRKPRQVPSETHSALFLLPAALPILRAEYLCCSCTQQKLLLSNSLMSSGAKQTSEFYSRRPLLCLASSALQKLTCFLFMLRRPASQFCAERLITFQSASCDISVNLYASASVFKLLSQTWIAAYFILFVCLFFGAKKNNFHSGSRQNATARKHLWFALISCLHLPLPLLSANMIKHYYFPKEPKWRLTENVNVFYQQFFKTSRLFFLGFMHPLFFFVCFNTDNAPMDGKSRFKVMTVMLWPPPRLQCGVPSITVLPASLSSACQHKLFMQCDWHDWGEHIHCRCRLRTPAAHWGRQGSDREGTEGRLVGAYVLLTT